MTQPTNYLPPEELTGSIAHYGIMEVPAGTTEPYFSPPIGLSGFILQTLNSSNRVFAKIDGRDFFTHNAVVTGQVTAPVYGEIKGAVKSILVFFQPPGLYRLFGTHMASLTNKSVKLSDFLGEAQAWRLMEKLRAHQNSEAQVSVLNEFFLALKPKGKDTVPLRKVLAYIHQKQGGLTVKEIEDYGQYHRRTLERHFLKMIGLSPKMYCQIYRFKCLINLLHAQPGITWARLAHEAGYYDQAHMSRYVRKYLNQSPNTLVNLDMKLINYLLKN